MRRSYSTWLAAFALLAALRPASGRADDLLVFAAASLSDALQAIAPEYEASSGVGRHDQPAKVTRTR